MDAATLTQHAQDRQADLRAAHAALPANADVPDSEQTDRIMALTIEVLALEEAAANAEAPTPLRSVTL